jgi:cytochrome c biogenesis protein
MAFDLVSIAKRLYKTLADLRTGVILLILVISTAAVGTFVLQRPVTHPDKMQSAYSPQTLYWLDRLTLTDVFHSWWFLTLLVLVSLSIIFVSIERFPNARRFYARPYRKTDAHFRAVNPYKTEIPVRSSDIGLNAAERAMRKFGWPERITDGGETSLYAEKHRFSVMAMYVIHASLLLIFLGGIIDGLFGFSGFMSIPQGQQRNVIELKNGKTKQLPFFVRCVNAGRENYADGTPKKWWSDLAVVSDGKEVSKKQIVVNDPLIYHGLRFFQASFWIDGKKVNALRITYEGADNKLLPLELKPDSSVQLDANTTVTLAEFLPDAFVRDGQVFKRSASLENLAFGLDVANRTDNSSTRVWLFPAERNILGGEALKYRFQNPTSAKDIDFLPVTGLEVAFEPGQWFVWTGCVLMGIGLCMAFYLVHMRVWAVVIKNLDGKLVLWVGGAANKNKDRFEQKFNELLEEIQTEVRKTTPVTRVSAPEQPESQLKLVGAS